MNDIQDLLKVADNLIAAATNGTSIKGNVPKTPLDVKEETLMVELFDDVYDLVKTKKFHIDGKSATVVLNTT